MRGTPPRHRPPDALVHAFSCDRCGQLVFFHNTACLRCGAALAFDPDRLGMVVLGGDGRERCANAAVAGCNWLAPPGGGVCASCALTRTRPGGHDTDALAAFVDAEGHKRRLVFNLRVLGIVLQPRDEATGTGVAFDLLSSSDSPVITGHASGVITLDLAESDDVHREQVRTAMREPYRTVLGHFRHEIGHHLFTVLVEDGDRDEVRDVFGDERASYQAALDRHYHEGAPDGWEADHVSAYATMHPAEDWAETFAHYLHLRATTETAAAYRIRVDGPDLPTTDQRPGGPSAGADTRVPPSRFAADPAALAPDASIEDVLAVWLPLSYALNAVARSLGDGDLYPFVLPPPVIGKLGVVHRLVGRAAARASTIAHG